MGTDTLIDILRGIYDRPRSIQSNFVRDHSYGVARLASLGLITTAITLAREVVYGNHWRVTFKGLRILDLGDNT